MGGATGSDSHGGLRPPAGWFIERLNYIEPELLELRRPIKHRSGSVPYVFLT